MLKSNSPCRFAAVFVCAMTVFIVMALAPSAFGATQAPDPLTIPFSVYDLGAPETKDWTIPINYPIVKDKVDIMYVVDTTGSMGGFRSTIASSLNSFTNDLYAAGANDIFVGAAFFGDSYVDDPWFGIELALGAHSAATYQSAISNLHVTGGGDGPEDACWAYMRTIGETAWRPGSQRIVVLITDAPTKYFDYPDSNFANRSIATIDGYNITAAGAAGLSDDYDIMPAIMTQGASQLSALVAELGVPEYIWNNQTQLNAALATGVIPNPTNAPTYEYEARVMSVSYLSDGAPSTDIAVTITPASFTIAMGESNQFDLKAISPAVPGRYNDTTVAEIGFFVDGVRIAGATQYLSYRQNRFELIYDENTTDAVTGLPAAAFYSFAETVTVQAGPVRAGYSFVEWNTLPDRSGTAYAPGDTFAMPDVDLTLYAIWLIDPPPPPPPPPPSEETTPTPPAPPPVIAQNTPAPNPATPLTADEAISIAWMALAVTICVLLSVLQRKKETERS